MKTPTILLGLILFASIVSANVILSPAAVYETNSAWIALDVDNYQGSFVISNVVVESPLVLTGAKSYLGWTKVLGVNSVEWKDGSLGTNVKSALFEYELSAPNVSSDANYTFNVKLNSVGSSVVLAVLNDASPPVISNLRPSGYARANNAMQAVSVDVVDSETSVAGVSYLWSDCNGSAVSVALVKSNDTYNGVADFSQFDEGEQVCYVVSASNVPGEVGNLSGVLLFDGTPPSVQIVSPVDYASESTDFVFNASDNLASVLSCSVLLDSTVLRTVNVSSGSQASVNVNLSDFTQGTHTWSVTCQDGVGLTATHAQVIELDTAPPVIGLDVPSTIPRTQSVQVTATVTDTMSLASVSATFDGDNLSLVQNNDHYTASISSDVLGDVELVVTAADSAGHVTTVARTIAVVPNHVLTLTLSPSSITPQGAVTASGTLTFDGNASVDEITLKTPGGDFDVDVSDGDYSRAFTAPDSGTYVITAEFSASGHLYQAVATLVVSSASQSTESGSTGWKSSWAGGSGYVKPVEEAAVEQVEESSNSELQTESPPAIVEYEPLPVPPSEPRSARTPPRPGATGVFDLGGTIKWLALFAAFAAVVGLATYAFKRKPKDESGIDWEGYFRNNGA